MHKEIEDFIKRHQPGITQEFEHFVDGTSLYAWNDSELTVHNDIAAGTIDLIGEDAITGERVLADIKTTETVHTESVRWQLSLYEWLYGANFDKLVCIQLRPTFCKIVELKPIDGAEVENLLECERDGRIYSPANEVSTALTEAQMQNLCELEKYIAELDERRKVAETDAKAMRAELLEAMEKRGLKKLEVGALTVTYVAPVVRQSIDTARLKEELPDVAKAYTKDTVTAASLRIKVAK